MVAFTQVGERTMPETSAVGRLLLARHGRTAWNLEERRLGRADVPLDDIGRAQAAVLEAACAGMHLDAVYASPLSRARDTAAPAARSHGLDVRLDADLLEFDYGEFCGTVRTHRRLKLRRDYLQVPVPGGESLSDAWQRARRFAERVAPALGGGAQILVVGHQRLNRLLAGVLDGRTLEQTVAAKDYRPANGSVLNLEVCAAAPSVGGLGLCVISRRTLAMAADENPAESPRPPVP